LPVRTKVGLGHAVGGDDGLLAVANDRFAVDDVGRVLAPHRLVHRLVGGGDVDGVEEFDLLVADAIGVGTGG
jgi:hypothetical protein